MTTNACMRSYLIVLLLQHVAVDFRGQRSTCRHGYVAQAKQALPIQSRALHLQPLVKGNGIEAVPRLHVVALERSGCYALRPKIVISLARPRNRAWKGTKLPFATAQIKTRRRTASDNYCSRGEPSFRTESNCTRHELPCRVPLSVCE